MNELRSQIDFNNQEIIKLKETLKKYYNRDVEDINIYEVKDTDNNLEEIIKKQLEDISKLNIIVDIEGQKKDNEVEKKLEELKQTEKDLTFSNFYRNGVVSINNIDVSVDKFFIRVLEKDGKSTFNIVCTDNRIDKSIIKTFNDKEYNLKELYKLKDCNIFYEMYLNKDIFVDNKLVINDERQLDIFLNYISKWTPERHKMVAETMIYNVL